MLQDQKFGEKFQCKKFGRKDFSRRGFVIVILLIPLFLVSRSGIGDMINEFFPIIGPQFPNVCNEFRIPWIWFHVFLCFQVSTTV